MAGQELRFLQLLELPAHRQMLRPTQIENRIENRPFPPLTHLPAGSVLPNSDQSQLQIALEQEGWSEAEGPEQAPKLLAERRSWFGMRRD